MTIDVESLLREADEYYASIEPEDVQVLLGGRILTARIPFMLPADFRNLTAGHLPSQEDLRRGLDFGLDGVSKNYPKIVLIDGDDEDDLRVIRGDEIAYRWPEIYEALSFEDRKSVQAAIWGMHIYKPEQRKEQIGAANG